VKYYGRMLVNKKKYITFAVENRNRVIF
jgi:hypothetical protein